MPPSSVATSSTNDSKEGRSRTLKAPVRQRTPCFSTASLVSARSSAVARSYSIVGMLDAMSTSATSQPSCAKASV